jgi:hypothetical protein
MVVLMMRNWRQMRKSRRQPGAYDVTHMILRASKLEVDVNRTTCPQHFTMSNTVLLDELRLLLAALLSAA